MRSTPTCAFGLLAVTLVIMGSTSALAQDAHWAWQNPFLAPNPDSNIHYDSWFTDTHTQPAPAGAQRIEADYLSQVTFDSPITGRSITRRLATCGALVYNAEKEVTLVCSSWPDLLRKETTWSIVSFDDQGEVTAYRGLKFPYDNLPDLFTNFAGIGYFFLDERDRIVLATPEGQIGVWRRTPSPVSDVDAFVQVRTIDVTTSDGPLKGKSLYGLMPNEQGYIWFTTTDGYVGTVAPEPCRADCIRFIDLNDPDGDGVRDPQPDGRMQRISESHSVDGLSTFQQTDYKMYRIDMQPDGTPEVAWERRYRRGVQVKPGQTSRGSGTSPSFFEIDGRQFVTIMDNAIRPNINVYRAEKELGRGERRLFAQAAPFGDRTDVSNENSLIVYPGTSEDSIRIYAENNWGNRTLASTIGPLVTRSGFGGIEVFGDGRMRVLRPNERIRIPNVVSKGNIPDNAIYTYNKRVDGWYLTALDADDVRNVIWTARVGPGRIIWNSWYSQLSQAADGKNFWVANVRLEPVAGRPAPGACLSYRDPADFVDVIGEIGGFEGGEIFYPEWLRAFMLGELASTKALMHEFASDKQLRKLVKRWSSDVLDATWLLWAAHYDANRLSDRSKARLEKIAARHDALVAELDARFESHCGP